MARKPIPKSTRQKVYDKYGGRCAYCGCELTIKSMQVDHLESVWTSEYVKGRKADDSLNNLMPSCRQCNFYKGSDPLEIFRKNLKTLMERVKQPFIYRLADKYGMVEEKTWNGKFYFEQL